MSFAPPASETLSDLHRAAGAKDYRARNEHGAVIDPVLNGNAARMVFGSGLSLSLVDLVNEVSVSETLAPPGRMLSLFLNGGPCDYLVEDGPLHGVTPGHAVFCASKDDYRCKLRVEPGWTYRFVSIGFDESWASLLSLGAGAREDPLLRWLDLGAQAPYCGSVPFDRNMHRLAEELYGYPSVGACGLLLAEARALEIVARIAERFDRATDRPVRRPEPIRLSKTDIERLHEARRLAERELDKPLTLTLLARRVGINVNKLKYGFKLVFGRTVTEHVVETRLSFAYELLASGDWPVSSVAYRIGYNPAYFAVAFQRRYGMKPSQVGKGATGNRSQ